MRTITDHTDTDSDRPTAKRHRVATIVSDVLSPILVPTFCYMIMMWLTPLVVLPERVRLLTMGAVATMTALVPLGTMLTLRRLGRVNDAAISDRRQRPLPMIIAILCYACTAWYLLSINAPWWMARFFIGAGVAALIALLITLRWKISAHMTAMGGMLALIAWLGFRHLLVVHPMVMISIVLVLCGVVGTCRLLLQRHSLGQVAAGFALGLCTLVVYAF